MEAHVSTGSLEERKGGRKGERKGNPSLGWSIVFIEKL